MRGDRGDIVVGWLTRIVAVLGVLGVLCFEAVSIGVTRVGAQDIAQNAAYDGAQAYRETRDVQRAYLAASAYAEEKGASIEPGDFVVQPDGSVSVTLHRSAKSMLFYRFGATKGWLEVEESASARPA